MLAHRGLALDVPENTLAALAAATAIGITHLETDVHATKDGVAVLAHDPDLRRLTGRSDPIRELTLAQLQTIDLGGGHYAPSLAEALAAFPAARFNIDVKDARAVAPTAAAVLAAHATPRVLIASFSSARRRRTSRLLPGVAVSASVPQIIAALIAAKIGWSPLIRLALRRIDAVQVPERRYGVRITTGRTVRLLSAAGVEMHVWTINEIESMKRLLALGVDGLVTDRADLAMELINAPLP